jgi:hypothetical protein
LKPHIAAGRYRSGEPAQGGMGSIYNAMDETLGILSR